MRSVICSIERRTNDRRMAEAWLALGAQEARGRQPSLGQDSGRRGGSGRIRAAPALCILDGQDPALRATALDDAIRAAKAALKIVPNGARRCCWLPTASAKKGAIDLALEAYQSAWGFDRSGSV